VKWIPFIRYQRTVKHYEVVAMKNLKVVYKIGIVLFIVFVAFLGLSIMGTVISKDLNNTLTNFYEHPFVVTNTLKDIKIKMQRIHLVLQDIYLENDRSKFMMQNAAINQLEQQILDEIRIVQKRFLGDKEKVVNLRNAFNASIEIHHEIIDTVVLGDLEAAKEIAVTSGETMSGKSEELIDELLLVADYIANKYIEDSEKAYRAQSTSIQVFGFAAFIVLIVAGFLLSRHIYDPLRKLVDAINIAKESNRVISLDTNRRDEIGKVSVAFAEMVEYAQKQKKEEMALVHDSFRNLLSNIHLGATLNEIVWDESENIVGYKVIEANSGYNLILSSLQRKSDKTYEAILFDIIKKAKEQNISFTKEIYIGSSQIHLDITAFPFLKWTWCRLQSILALRLNYFVICACFIRKEQYAEKL